MENNNIEFEQGMRELEAKNSYRKVIFSYLLYFFLSNLLADPFSKMFNSKGLLMIAIVTPAIIPIYFIIGKKGLEIKNSSEEKSLSLKEIVFFVGIMYTASLVFGLVTNKLVEIFSIPSPNVTEQIQKSMDFPLFIYVVLVGPFIEELQYRGFYLNFTRKHGKVASILLATIVFSFAHLNFIQGFGTLGLGMVLSYVAYFYSFKSAVILHILNNLIVAIIGFVAANQLLTSILSSAILALMIYAIHQLLTKRKEILKRNLSLDDKEKSYLKILFTDPVFIGYMLLIVAFSIYIGYKIMQ